MKKIIDELNIKLIKYEFITTETNDYVFIPDVKEIEIFGQHVYIGQNEIKAHFSLPNGSRIEYKPHLETIAIVQPKENN